MIDDAAFALCLTHDVDRPYKRHQALFYAARERSTRHLLDVLPGRNPYWQFDEITALEDDLGVRSAFYFLNDPDLFREQPPRRWFDPVRWIQHLGRYDPTSDEIAAVIRSLADGGWEVGLHGSYDTADDPERLRREVVALESVLGDEIVGGRQHYLRLSVPRTWRHLRDVGLRYDSSLGSSTDYGFAHGYRPLRPFNDDFLVFPLTVMEQTLPSPAESYDDAWAACESLLAEAAANDAVMTALWHPRYFSETDFPGYRRLYRRLVERALEMGAWVGPPRDLYDALVTDDVAADETDLVADGGERSVGSDGF